MTLVILTTLKSWLLLLFIVIYLQPFIFLAVSHITMW